MKTFVYLLSYFFLLYIYTHSGHDTHAVSDMIYSVKHTFCLVFNSINLLLKLKIVNVYQVNPSYINGFNQNPVVELLDYFSFVNNIYLCIYICMYFCNTRDETWYTL